MNLHSIGTPALWAGFMIFVLAMLALDLGVFHRKAHRVLPREALTWTVVWVALALLFNFGLYHYFGLEAALQFFTGYLMEKALSVDNLFVFLVLFSFFRVPEMLQHRVLFWGILGALVMRGLFIFLGAALVQRFHWVLYVFGVFLVYTGIKLVLHREQESHPENNRLLRLLRRVVPSVPDFRGDHFVVKEGGRLLATPLLMVLVAVELTDIVFAVDSIPAIFGITTDPFIVFTSNVFAILGLRALYFFLAHMMGKFRYLGVGLGVVLAFVGAKMLIEPVYNMPITLSLAVVAIILLGSVLLSWLVPIKAASTPDGGGHVG